MDSIESIDPQFRLDAEVAPVYKCTNYDSEERTFEVFYNCLLYTSPSPRDAHESRMPSSA